MTTNNIVEALHDRMALAAEAMADRVDNPGLWSGYTHLEGLIGRYTRPASLGGAPTVEYWRPGHDDATITLGFLRMTDIKEESKGAVSIIEDGIEERRTFDASLRSPIRDSRTIEHTFESTESFSESAKKAWEVAAKASLSVEYAGIKGALEVSGKYGEELSRQSSHSQTTRDTIRETFEFEGPIEFRVEAYRSRNRESRVVRARCDFDGKMYWTTGESAWEFTTYKTQFIPIAKRIAPDDIYGYREFMRAPLSDCEIAALEAPSGKIVEYVVEYDNVTVEHLKEV